MKPIFLKINVMRIDKSKLFPGKNGAQYLDAVMLENKDGPDQYGNQFVIMQSVSREDRAKGVKGNIIGNGKISQGPGPAPVAKAPEPADDEPDSQVPF